MAKVRWVDLDPAMFPKEVQAAVAAIHKAETECYNKVKPLKAEVDRLMTSFAPRIQAPAYDPDTKDYTGPQERVLVAGETMKYAYRNQFSGESRFACGSVEPKTRKAKVKAVLA